MRHLIILIPLLLIGAFAFTAFSGICFTVSKNLTVKGKVIITEDYCGGAAPSPEVLSSLKSEKPYAGQILCIKKWKEDFGTEPVLQEITTNENGVFSLVLPKGKYGFFVKEKTQDFSKGIMAKFGNSPKCKSWQNTPDIVLEVTKKSKKLQTFRFHKNCNPCLPPRP